MITIRRLSKEVAINMSNISLVVATKGWPETLLNTLSYFGITTFYITLDLLCKNLLVSKQNSIVSNSIAKLIFSYIITLLPCSFHEQ